MQTAVRPFRCCGRPLICEWPETRSFLVEMSSHSPREVTTALPYTICAIHVTVLFLTGQHKYSWTYKNISQRPDGAIREMSESKDCQWYSGSFILSRSRVIITLCMYFYHLRFSVLYQQKYWPWFQISMWQMSQGSTSSSINAKNLIFTSYIIKETQKIRCPVNRTHI